MSAPRNLKHKPIIEVDYQNRDMQFNHGDAEFLSLGFAQWNNPNHDIACKVFRRCGKNTVHWSRQSEELPLWRLLDMVILVAAVNKQGVQFTGTPIPVTNDFNIVLSNRQSKNLPYVLQALQDPLIQAQLAELKKWL